MIRIFRAFTAALLIGTPTLTANASAPKQDMRNYEFCGYEWAEPAPEYLAEFNRVEQQRVSLGYVRVCDRVLQYADFQKETKPWRTLLPTLGFIPVDLGATPFAGFELVGGVLNLTIPSFAFLQQTDHATRVFRRNDGLIISLEEWDLTIIGGGVAEVYRVPDVRVNGWPGYWEISQSKSGKAVSRLWWQGATRKFEITVNANLKLHGGQLEILRLAETIPPGVPSGKEKPAVTIIGIPGVLSKRPIPSQPDF